MEWTNDKVINLIDLYRDRPVLWDCRLKEFKDKNKRTDALLEIAVSFGVEKDEVERKIKNLLCHFSRELKKEREGTKSGAGGVDIYKSKWFCFDSMLFLKNRKRSRGITDTQDQKTSEDVEIIEEETQIEEPKGKKRETVFNSLNAQPGLQKTLQSSAIEEALSIIKDIQGRNALKDQYTAFGEEIGMRIRDLPSSHAKKLVKHRISNILFEAEMGKYDNPN